ncbi:sterol desaturase/sphingolipid hydroxylase (fatty acid hydroxylase superfamily) [Runella defluvii]|uniref:Sterol desaturase/sphingolipid hydroxylase (Fatty acid hydroxylase superfamily) n=1 Tax=Runella defluvii TaxID=370973 RepID=A0A7W5ZIT5_9BACT|nr:sterol desaturase family protein [Runella defluvii]MBB3836712.1 sterol desaturase/sphingolipid hydroxylase (fatty acid hydroxylase superfamily) [Runella defluvii]
MSNELEQTIIQLTTPLYALLIGLEALLSHRQHRDFYTWRDTLTNFVLMLLNGGIDLAFRAVYVVVLVWFYQYHVTVIDNVYLYWFLLFLAEDFVFYILHVVDHYCRLFWAVHVTHHSSEHFNLTTGFRSSVFQPLYRFVYFIPLVLFGFKPADIVLMYSITQTYGILVHTNYLGKLGWLGYVFVTPSHHRVHHASNVAYLDKNMGMCLIIWDRLFGTFQEELDQEPVRYGLTKSLEDTSLGNTIFHEWKAIAKDLGRNVGITTKLKYLLNPPGWSHDGSTLTSNQLRELEEKQKSSSSVTTL